MGATQILSGILLLSGAGVCVFACFMPWRIGAGAQGLEAFPGMLSPGFEKREYGLFAVTGNKKRTWNDLMHLTCDRAAKVEVAAGAVETGGCEGEIGERLAEECSEHFLSSIQHRCKTYNNIFAASKGTFFGTCGIAVFGLIGALAMLIPKGPLVAQRPLVLPIGIAAYIASGFICGAYAYLTDMEFWSLGKDTMFPYPSLATGFYAYVGAMHLYFVGGFAAFSNFNGTAEVEKEGEPLADQAEPVEGETI